MTEKPPEVPVGEKEIKIIQEKKQPQDKPLHEVVKEEQGGADENRQPTFLSGMRTRRLKTYNGQNSLENFEEFFTDFSKSCTEQDKELARILLEKNKINIFQLKDLLDFQKKAWQEGNAISLEKILIEKAMLYPREIAFLKEEAETKKIPTALPIFENREVVEDKYVILEKIGSGNTGAVYKVEYLKQCRQVFSLKILHPFFVCNVWNIDCLVQEVQVAMQLRHPNILSILEFGMLPNKSPYFLTEYSPGKSLKLLLKERWKWDSIRSLRITRQILAGLIHAHSLSIYHSHLKPANILIENGIYNPEHAKITDFGLSKLLENGKDIGTLTHGSLEAMAYMSPEHACKSKIDQRSDLYCVAILLYEMLTGKPVFEADNLSDMLFKQVFKKAIAPSEINPDIHPNLDKIILKALEKEPEKRFQSAEEFLIALKSFKNPSFF